jgi:hypothetical protein
MSDQIERIAIWNRKSAKHQFSLDLGNHLRRHWFFDFVQVAAVLCFVFWSRHLPAPGYAVAVIGVLAAAMSLHLEMQAWQKALWMILIGGFLILEFTAIRKDRSDFADAESTKRKEQLSQFNTIVENSKSVANQNQAQFEKMMSGIGKNIDTVTGANDYGYIVYNIGQGSMAFIHVGEHPLYEVEARFVDTDNMNAAPLGVVISIGNCAPHVARLLNPMPFKDPRQNFTITFLARNGSWLEQLRLRKVDGKWVQALRVLKVEVNGETKRVLHEDIPKDYPLDGNGKMDWDK